MNLRDLHIKISYHSQGSENIVDSFINPALKCTQVYKRSVGFFSSSVFSSVLEGIESLVKNGGSIRLIASPKLSQEDIDAINAGYREKGRVVEDTFSREFYEELNQFGDEDLILLAKLVASGVLKIMIVVTETTYGDGMYHDKFGILEDFDGNKVVFYGSPNSSRGGYRSNFEKIRVVKSWVPGQDASVQDEELEFDSLWSRTNPLVSVYDFNEAIRNNILEVINRRGLNDRIGDDKDKEEINHYTGIRLRDYQKKAIQAWLDNDCKGFFVMATGTGKTWTAIYAAKNITEKENILLVICAPYKHLIKQWAEDIKKVYHDNEIVMISSENPRWQSELADALLNSKYGNGGTVIAISTIKSFYSPAFQKISEKTDMRRMLIVDEAHRFTNRDARLQAYYNYLLGLSATPSSKKNDEKGKELTDFFGGQVFYLPIEEAIKKRHLVHYNYFPIYVHSTEKEENDFRNYTSKIASCWRHNVCIDPEECAKQMRNRLRVIAMSEEKRNNFHYILGNIKEKNHLIVYCGDGRVFSDSGEEIRHIKFIKDLLTNEGFRTSQFTASENMKVRMELVNSFNKGMIDCLVAIRCLDEGINIPSIDGALILASNDDYREFVQRRGRILRKYTDEYTGQEKRVANIYDVIVLPSIELDNWAKIELRRYYEYARLADNHDELMDDLMQMLNDYRLEIEDVMETEEEMERELDE